MSKVTCLAAAAASLLVACGCDHDHAFAEEPACASPAPLIEAKEGRIEGQYIVEMREASALDELAARHYLEIEQRLPIVNGFVARMRPATVAAVRCEPSVARLTENRRAFAGTAP